MSTDRRGEKLGWSLGWMGGFIWVLALVVVFLFQQKVLAGLGGILLIGVAVFAVHQLAPWRHPNTVYWKLMLGPYLVFFLSMVWAVFSFGGTETLDLNWWNFLWIVPTLGPFGILGNRKWKDGESKRE
uniref:Uncharacterized protein n=1 Tax=Desulfatirhabdium butyrativorans TaxID=340467 RepID=A0A7C4RT95_9BACT